MRLLDKTDAIAGAIIVVGALNWGLVGLTKRDAVAAAVGRKSPTARGIYGAVGASALYQLARFFGPKTKRERTLNRADGLLDDLEKYQETTRRYLKSADTLINGSIKKLRTARS